MTKNESVTMNKDKACSKCGLTKKLEEFHKKSGSKDGLYSYCKTCSHKLNGEYAKKKRADVVNENKNRKEQDRIKETKVCTKCGIEKSKTSFSVRSDRGTFNSRCKECEHNRRKKYHIQNSKVIKEKRKTYRKNNKEKCFASEKKYYENNKESKLAYGKEYYQKNKDRHNAIMKEYYVVNKENVLEKSREYKLKNREIIIEKSRTYYLLNIERIKERNKQHYEDNKELSFEKARKRRAIKSLAIKSFTKKDIEGIYVKQSGGCVYCGTSLITFHVDHIYPLCDFKYNGVENLQLLCQPCNNRKWKHDPIAYESKINFLTEDRLDFLTKLKQHIEQELAEHFTENVTA